MAHPYLFIYLFLSHFYIRFPFIIFMENCIILQLNIIKKNLSHWEQISMIFTHSPYSLKTAAKYGQCTA